LIHRLQQCRYLLLVLLLATLQSQAQQASAPKTQIIHAGKLLDVRTGHIAADAYITVTGDRIGLHLHVASRSRVQRVITRSLI
jgi:hypothetical protein